MKIQTDAASARDIVSFVKKIEEKTPHSEEETIRMHLDNIHILIQRSALKGYSLLKYQFAVRRSRFEHEDIVKKITASLSDLDFSVKVSGYTSGMYAYLTLNIKW